MSRVSIALCDTGERNAAQRLMDRIPKDYKFSYTVRQTRREFLVRITKLDSYAETIVRDNETDAELDAVAKSLMITWGETHFGMSGSPEPPRVA